MKKTPQTKFNIPTSSPLITKIEKLSKTILSNIKMQERNCNKIKLVLRSLFSFSNSHSDISTINTLHNKIKTRFRTNKILTKIKDYEKTILTAPSNDSIALLTSSAEPKVTKPKPFDLPLSLS